MNIRQQFIENMINATVSNRERILTAALQAYSPGVVSFHYRDNLVCTKHPNGDEVYSYRGDPIIRFMPPQYGWQQKPDSLTFNATQGYELLFDIEEQHPFFEPNGEKP